MARLHVLKVFVGEDGAGGNPLGVFLDGSRGAGGRAAAGRRRPRLLRDGVRGRRRARRRFASLRPRRSCPSPVTRSWAPAWLLAPRGSRAADPAAPGGRGACQDRRRAHLYLGRPEWAPEFEHVELGSAAEVEALDGPPGGHDLVGVWAWDDRANGQRARQGLSREVWYRRGRGDGGATPFGSPRGWVRTIRIQQGVGSVIFAEPRPDGSVEIGGQHGARRDAGLLDY